MPVHHADDSSFETEVTQHKGTVLVDFWAPWCGPCKMLGPVLDDLAKDMGDKVKVVKVDIDENPMAPTNYGVRSVPTLMLFKDGKLVDSKVGLSSKTSLEEWITQKG